MEPIFEKDIEEILPQVVAWRRHFHQYPESSFNEVATPEFLLNEIEKLGNVKITRPMETGLVVQVPDFINEGEKLVIGTENGDYKSRANSQPR